jgi:DNA-binding CsgD family transcriptional regulator
VVREFQRRAGLAVDGIAGPRTLGRLGLNFDQPPPLPDRPFFYCASGTWATPPELVSSFTAQVRQHAQGQAPHLSERERQILQLIADGKSVPDMATELFLAQTTIKTHIRRLYEKLGVSDRGAAVAQAMRNQLLE